MIPEKQGVLDAIARKYLSDPEPTAPQPNGHRAPDLSDEEIIAKLRRAKNSKKFERLFDHGDTSAYDGDDSDADLALIGIMRFYTEDPDQLDRLFRRSALMRPKWDSRRGGSTYGRRTIAEALHSHKEVYSAPASDAGSRSFSFALPNREINENDPPKRPIAVRFAEMGPPEPRRYLIGNLVPEAYPTVLYGDGGVAKSMLALSAAVALARGSGTWLGRAVDGGPALYLDFELDAQEQNRRVNRLARAEGLTQPPPDLLYMSGLGFTLGATFDAAYEQCKEHGVRFMVLDSLGPALQGDAEAARDVIAFYQRVLEPFRAIGVTTLVIDHQSKLQAGERYQNKRAFGSVFKQNLSRSVLQLQATDRTENRLALRLRQVKHNFGPLADPFGVELTFTEEMVTVKHTELEPSALAEEATLNAPDRVRYALKGGHAFPEDIADATGLALATVKSTLSKLRKSGEVESTGERGKWGTEQVRLSSLSTKGNENDPGSGLFEEDF